MIQSIEGMIASVDKDGFLHAMIRRDLEEFTAKGLPGESWDVYLTRRGLERWLESEAGQVREE